MAICAVCEKQIPDEATHCSASCLSQARLDGFAKISKARHSFDESVTKMLKMENEPSKPPELAMVIVKHRWKRNRSEVVGDTVFSFNELGEARVPFMGHVLVDVEALVKASHGLVEYKIEQPVVAPVEAPEVKAQAPVVEIPVVPAPVVEPVVEDYVQVDEPEPKKEEELLTSVSEEVVSNDQSVRRPVRPKKK